MDSMRKRILISTLGILTLVAILAGLVGVVDAISKSGPAVILNVNPKPLNGINGPKIDVNKLKGLADLLGKIDPGVLKNLANLLGKIDPGIRDNLVNLLGKIDPNSLKDLVNLLSKIDPNSLKDLASILSKIDPSGLKDIANLSGNINIDPGIMKDLANLLSGMKLDPGSLKDIASLLGKIDPGSLKDLASLLNGNNIDTSNLKDLINSANIDAGGLKDLANLVNGTNVDTSGLKDMANLVNGLNTDPNGLKDLANSLSGTKIDSSGLSDLANLFNGLYGMVGTGTPGMPSDESSLSKITLFKVSGAANTSLLRTGVVADLKGNSWKFDPNAKIIPYNGEPISSPVKGFSQKLTDEISVYPQYGMSNGEFPVPTSLYSSSISSSKPLNYMPDDHVFISEQGLPESYSFQSTQYKFDTRTLDNAKVDPVPDYSGLPSTTTPRTRQLAEDITGILESPYEKAKAIEKYLKDNYSYDVNYKPAPKGTDPIDWFLFEEKKGVGANFNSAFVTLARSVGITSRLVSGFSIKPQSGEQEVLAGQAKVWSEVKFKDIGWITFDATGNPPKPLVTTTQITSDGLITSKGRSLTIHGKVQAQGVTVEGMLIEIYINPKKSHEGGLLVGRGPVNQGTFNIEITVPEEQNVGNYQLIAHARESLQFQESWSDPVIKITSGTQIALDVSPKVKQSEPVVIKGKLTEEFNNNKPIAGQLIVLAFNGKTISRVTSAQNGQFQLKQPVDDAGEYILDATFNGTEYYVLSHQQATFQVLIPTTIRPQAPQKANSQDAVLISGFLIEEKTGSGIPGQSVEILANGQSLTKLTTLIGGQFTFKHTFPKAGIYQLEARFSGASQYWESRGGTVLQIYSARGPVMWIYPVILAAVLAGAGGAYFLYRRRQWRVVPAAASDSQVVEVPESVPLEMEVKRTSQIKLIIEYPGIEPALPDVWGAGDNLEILCRLADANDLPMSARMVQISMGKTVSSVQTDASGTARMEHLFAEKGQYELTAEYNGGNDIESTITSRKIRIVDYREEIVELYRALRDWFPEIGIVSAQDATPREVEQIVTKSGKGISGTALNQAMTCFEEADYSLHPVKREHYKIMYLAQKDIREYGHQSGQTQNT